MHAERFQLRLIYIEDTNQWQAVTIRVIITS